MSAHGKNSISCLVTKQRRLEKWRQHLEHMIRHLIFQIDKDDSLWGGKTKTDTSIPIPILIPIYRLVSNRYRYWCWRLYRFHFLIQAKISEQGHFRRMAISCSLTIFVFSPWPSNQALWCEQVTVTKQWTAKLLGWAKVCAQVSTKTP